MAVDQETLSEVKTYLRSNWQEGCTCPACGQHVQLYDYKLFATSAYALILLYRLGEGYHHISHYAEAKIGKARAPHFAELRFWGMVEAMPKGNDPTKKASGYWRITESGKRFVRGELTVWGRILVFNNKFQGFSSKAKQITIMDALENRFDYAELMG